MYDTGFAICPFYHPHSLQMGGKQPSLFRKPFDFYDSSSDEFVCFICFTSNPSHTWSLTGAMWDEVFPMYFVSVLPKLGDI